ncbi:hypothetical protein LEN26_006986 [Aphanomyces euteiches]|nr:hypothetical protein AeMF1_012828 [Aphanomyces euteiches]KAH9133805.1 hypothetical protein LEN26_006986 [Aphanomyces euteiches]
MASKPTTAQQVQVEEPPVSINVSIDCNSAVKDQDHCGSWYRRVCLSTAGEHLDLSEQQTLNEDAYSYASDKLGVPGACQTNCTKKQLTLGLSKWTSIEANLNVLHVQPITVTVQGGNPVWRNYRSKFVTQWPGVRSDHAVVDVGYGTNGTLSFFKIQNSSGSRCGQSGYMHKRGVGGTSTNHHLETNNEANDDEKSTPPPKTTSKPKTISTKQPAPTIRNNKESHVRSHNNGANNSFTNKSFANFYRRADISAYNSITNYYGDTCILLSTSSV